MSVHLFFSSQPPLSLCNSCSLINHFEWTKQSWRRPFSAMFSRTKTCCIILIGHLPRNSAFYPSNNYNRSQEYLPTKNSWGCWAMMRRVHRTRKHPVLVGLHRTIKLRINQARSIWALDRSNRVEETYWTYLRPLYRVFIWTDTVLRRCQASAATTRRLSQRITFSCISVASSEIRFRL